MKFFVNVLLLVAFIVFQSPLYGQYSIAEERIILADLTAFEDNEIPVVYSEAVFSDEKEALNNYFNNNLTYPELAFDYGIEGTVWVNFIVQKDGQLAEVNVVKSIGYGCEEAAIKAIENMPNWIPAQLGEQKVATKVLFAVAFKLQ